jgi:hypothetical protein
MWKKLTQNINRQILYWTSVLIFILIIPSFFAAWGADEGTLGNNPIWIFFSELFSILRFPTHTLFWWIIGIGGPFTFFGGLILNSMFYGLLIERLVYFLKRKSI